ncbi:RICIN domain-containing protein [Frankia gtarii]|uniref:RICIN domain-containing protein n=1 Tax=Frankia gtarii TaxID=2950102 RepID=UPI0021BF6310|nr:RICIN domain-containing protein [Frankia gtarii]
MIIKFSRFRRIFFATLAATLLALGVSVVDAPVASAAPATFTLRSQLNNKCLELLSFNNNNGAPAGMWDCWGGANQNWYWDGSQIRNQMNNKCLELLSFNNSNGAPVGLWDCWNGTNQRWYWDGSQLRNRFNNKCLEVLSFNNNNGARAGLWDCWGGANQHWYTRNN